jgi:hypothetical protein
MQITIDLLDDIAQHTDPGREALEAVAIEGFRSGVLPHYQVSQRLGLSRFDFDGFLKARNIYDHAYDIAISRAILKRYGGSMSGKRRIERDGRRGYLAAQLSGPDRLRLGSSSFTHRC